MNSCLDRFLITPITKIICGMWATPSLGSFRKALAEAVHCRTAYFSQIPNGSYHLSLEQSEAATRFLSLSRGETRCLIRLVAFFCRPHGSDNPQAPYSCDAGARIKKPEPKVNKPASRSQRRSASWCRRGVHRTGTVLDY